MCPGDDAGIGPRLALADGDALAFRAQSVARKDRLGEDQFVVAEVGDERPERRVGTLTPTINPKVKMELTIGLPNSEAAAAS